MVRLCKCHGEPMATRGRKKGAEKFECVIRKRERVRAWKIRNREAVAAQKRRWWNKPGGGIHQRRDAVSAQLDRQIEEVLSQHPELREVVDAA